MTVDENRRQTLFCTKEWKQKLQSKSTKATFTLPTYFDVTRDFCSSMVMLVVHIPTTWQCSVLFMSSTGWSRVRSMCMLFLKYWEFKREFQQQQTFCRDEATTPSYGSTLSWEILHTQTHNTFNSAFYNSKQALFLHKECNNTVSWHNSCSCTWRWHKVNNFAFCKEYGSVLKISS